MVKRSQRGFTLLEVMVALAVLAITMSALVKGGAQSAANAAYLRDKSFAHWVGLNVVAELQLQGTWATGNSNGVATMAGHDWYWRSKVEETLDEDVRRLEVSVSNSREKESAPLAHLVAFLGTPEPGEADK